MISPGAGRGATSLDLEIEVVGAPVLRRSAEPVAAVDPDLRQLVQRMFSTMQGELASRRMTLARYRKLARRKSRNLRRRDSAHERGWSR